ncbi:MAG TPA: o-succinylbenzoate synthase [Actinomycetota bacterium]|nr:o-succinylbenzoate synthase [Actinomycetota bacterium]
MVPETQLRTFGVDLVTTFREVDRRTGVLMKGPLGWGEFSPFPGYGPEETMWWYRAAIEAATQPWPEPVREKVPVNAIVPAVGPEAAHALVRASGCSTVKVKVGDRGSRERVAAVRDALGPAGHIRIDVNGAWDVATATKEIRELARFDLEYVEQPVETLVELAELRLQVDVPLAADESIRRAPDPFHLEGIGDACDLAILKVQPLGGVRRALAIAEAIGLPPVVSSAVETSVGLSAGLALAAALPELGGACGLGTAALLAADVTDEPLLPEGGWLGVRRVTPDEAKLEEVAAGEEERDIIMARFRAAEGWAHR